MARLKNVSRHVSPMKCVVVVKRAIMVFVNLSSAKPLLNPRELWGGQRMFV